MGHLLKNPSHMDETWHQSNQPLWCFGCRSRNGSVIENISTCAFTMSSHSSVLGRKRFRRTCTQDLMAVIKYGSGMEIEVPSIKSSRIRMMKTWVTLKPCGDRFFCRTYVRYLDEAEEKHALLKPFRHTVSILLPNWIPIPFPFFVPGSFIS